VTGDAERASAERALQHHYSAGRLDEDELERRLDRVYAARDRRELRRTYRDLPRPPEKSRWRRLHRVMVRLHAVTFGAVNAAFVGVWALMGADEVFWPGLSIIPWGSLLAWHAWGVPWALRKAQSRLLGR
jgi:uncharacterized protein DUF1707